MTSLFQAIDAQRDRLAPATAEQIRSACAALVLHADAAGIKCPDVESLFAVWATHCREMPGELLSSGLAQVLRNWTNTFCLPAPGAVWEQIEFELARMRRDLAKLEGARNEVAEDLDPLDRKLSKETDAVIADTLKLLKAKSAEVKIW